jgi:hypothetical protein
MKIGGILYLLGAVLILLGSFLPMGGTSAFSSGSAVIYFLLFALVLLSVINAFIKNKGLAITTLVLSIIFFVLYLLVVLVLGMLSAGTAAVTAEVAKTADAATQKQLAEVNTGVASLMIPFILVLVGIVFEFIGSIMGMKKAA